MGSTDCSDMIRAKRFKFGTVCMIIQVVFILLFAFLGDYAAIADPKRSMDKGEDGVPLHGDPNSDLNQFYPGKRSSFRSPRTAKQRYINVDSTSLR